MITIYGIRNCDTVKKSLFWFDEQGITYRFHDFKKESLDPALLSDWLAQTGWQALVNCKGSTWRKLGLTPEVMESSAHSVIMDNLSLIRRPLVSCAGVIATGFEPQKWTDMCRRLEDTDQA
ncbi:MAG TPA: ArsC/Spx/MgsR family protein [Fluviicoccus sp.]|nr:ArsC/Spx/MgsR family protein [Fluviicoccus sp.]